MDNTEGLYLVTFEIESMGYLWQNDSEQVKGMVAGMESAQGGLLQQVIVASKNRVGGNRASSVSLWLQMVGVLEWLGCLC